MNPQTGQTALSIAQKLGYISVVETLKVVTDEVNNAINTHQVMIYKTLIEIIVNFYQKY